MWTSATFASLCIIGGLLADGMIIFDLYSAFKRDVAMAIGFGGKLMTIFFQLFQKVFFIATALIFSWIAIILLYMYLNSKEDRENL